MGACRLSDESKCFLGTGVGQQEGEERTHSVARHAENARCARKPLTQPLRSTTLDEVAGKSIWKRDANEVIDPRARSFLRWLERHWWAPLAAAIPTFIGIALWVFVR